MKLSGRDKKLLIGLLILAALALPIFFVVMPLKDKIDAEKAEIKALQERYEYLSGLYGQITQFRQGTQDYKENIAEVVYKFPADIQQENTIMFLLETERNIPIELYQVAFTPTSTLPIGTVTSDLSGVMETTEKLGQQFTGAHTMETIGFRVPYEDFKNFINYIEQWKDRLTISNLSAVYSLENNEVSGSFMINQYAIRNDGFVLEEPKTDVNNGTHNIFSADDERWAEWLDEEEQSMNQGEVIQDEKEEPEETDSSKDDKKEEVDDKKEEADDKKDNTTASKPIDSKGYDVYFMLNQPQSEADAMIVGCADDTTGKNTVKSDKNRSRLTRFTFTEEEGKIYISYKLSYWTRKQEITPGEDIVLNIYSCNRANRDDLVESSVAVINETKKTVQVNIMNDDDKDPRIEIREKSGKVVINQ